MILKMIIRRLRYYSDIESLRSYISQRMFAFTKVVPKYAANIGIPAGMSINAAEMSKAAQQHLSTIPGYSEVKNKKGKITTYLINGEVPTAEHWKGFNYDQYLKPKETKTPAATPTPTAKPEPEYYKSWNDVYDKHGNMNVKAYKKMSGIFKDRYGERIVAPDGRKGYLLGDKFTEEGVAIQDFHKSKEGQEFFGNSKNFNKRGSVKYDSATGRYAAGSQQTNTSEAAGSQQTNKPGWWGRRSKFTKGLIIGGTGLAGLAGLVNYNLSSGADEGTKYTERHGGF